ncbi:MAG: hypothetical protein GYA21_04205 [Myxococcales bacterium]|nr:hypothetical protein [Myxococcales bacterium]
MKAQDLIGLPVAVQGELRRAEREFLEALQDMGLDREALAIVAERSKATVGRRGRLGRRAARGMCYE